MTYDEELRKKQAAGGAKRVPTKGFGHPERRQLASELGKVGGRKSRRGPAESKVKS